jgi:flagellar basal body-associated protein FliL
VSDKKDEPKPKGKAKGLLLGAVGLILVIAISSVAGAALSPVIGPRLHPQAGAPPAPRPHKPPSAEAEEEEDDGDESEEDKKKNEAKAVMTVDAIVVDLRVQEGGEPHHLKIGIAIELKAELPEEEGKLGLMRVKDAAITYLRTLTYEDVTDHAKFEAVRKELSAHVLKAAGGKKHAKKMLITEYVVQ